jgi:hypothetical protein
MITISYELAALWLVSIFALGLAVQYASGISSRDPRDVPDAQ